MNYKAGCWLHSVWSPLASRVQVDVRARRVHSQTGGDAPLLTIGHHLVPLTLSDWRLATPRWSKFAKLRQQSVCSHFRGAGGRKWREKREGVESSRSSSSSVWAVIFTLIFSFEKSSTLQGVVTVKCFEFVSCGNCFSPRLTSAASEQFEKSEFCRVEDSYALYTPERHFCWAQMVCLLQFNRASQRELTPRNSTWLLTQACMSSRKWGQQFNTPVMTEKGFQEPCSSAETSRCAGSYFVLADDVSRLMLATDAFCEHGA